MSTGKCPRCGAQTQANQPACKLCGLQFRRTAEEAPTALMPVAGVKVPRRNRGQAGLPAVFAILAVLAILGVASTATIEGLGKNRGSLAHITASAQYTPVSVEAISAPSTTPPLSVDVTPTLPTAATVEATSIASGIPPQLLTSIPPPASGKVKPDAGPSQPVANPKRVLPGIGSTAANLQGWSIKLDGLATRFSLWSDNPYTTYKPKGAFWLVYLVYRNDSDEVRSLDQSVDFILEDTNDKLYPEMSDHGKDADMVKIAQAEQANPLSALVQPHRQTATLLVFDIPKDVQPTFLVTHPITEGTISPDIPVVWKLGQN